MQTFEERMEAKIGNSLGMKVSHYADYHDGFSFTVSTELEAYKAAYKYQGVKRVIVRQTVNINAWLVQVYIENFIPPSTLEY